MRVIVVDNDKEYQLWPIVSVDKKHPEFWILTYEDGTITKERKDKILYVDGRKLEHHEYR